MRTYEFPVGLDVHGPDWGKLDSQLGARRQLSSRLTELRPQRLTEHLFDGNIVLLAPCNTVRLQW